MNERTATARALILDSAAATAVRCLRDVGVESILLKGPVLARWLYDDGSVRTYGDVDLLVSPRHTEAAVAALGAMGYKDRLESATERGAVPHARSLGAPVSGATGFSRTPPVAARLRSICTARSTGSVRLTQSSGPRSRAAARRSRSSERSLGRRASRRGQCSSPCTLPSTDPKAATRCVISNGRWSGRLMRLGSRRIQWPVG